MTALTWTKTVDGGREACVQHCSIVMVDGAPKVVGTSETLLEVRREWDCERDWWGRGWRLTATNEQGHPLDERNIRTRAEALRRAEAWSKARGERLAGAAQLEAGR